MESQHVKFTVVLFSNPISGSRLGKEYLDLKVSSMVFSEHSELIEVLIYDLTEEVSRNAGAQKLNELLLCAERVRAVTAGGDGSLSWLIGTCLAFNVDIARVEFGILPFGTGNDLAASAGWGRAPLLPILGPHCAAFLRYAKLWVHAIAMNFDIWDISIETAGYFEYIQTKHNAFSREHFQDEHGDDSKVFRKLMTNYFSVGLDARIGLGFDKRRTNYKACNKLMYCWEGFKKICCLPLPRIAEIVTAFYDGDEPVFDSAVATGFLPKNTAVLLALNTPTYGGGEHFVWNCSKNSLKTQNYQDSSTRDGMLEFMAFRGAYGLALEQFPCTKGRSHRFHQGRGPFEINFESESRVYMEIDGENFCVVNPKKMVIRLSDISAENKVKLLVNYPI